MVSPQYRFLQSRIDKTKVKILVRPGDSPRPEPTAEPLSEDIGTKGDTPMPITENEPRQESESVGNLPAEKGVEAEKVIARTDSIPIIKRLTGKRPKLPSIRSRFIEVTE